MELDVEERDEEEDNGSSNAAASCWGRFERRYVKAFFIRQTAEIRENENSIELGSVRGGRAELNGGGGGLGPHIFEDEPEGLEGLNNGEKDDYDYDYNDDDEVEDLFAERRGTDTLGEATSFLGKKD